MRVAGDERNDVHRQRPVPEQQLRGRLLRRVHHQRQSVHADRSVRERVLCRWDLLQRSLHGGLQRVRVGDLRSGECGWPGRPDLQSLRVRRDRRNLPGHVHVERQLHQRRLLQQQRAVRDAALDRLFVLLGRPVLEQQLRGWGLHGSAGHRDFVLCGRSMRVGQLRERRVLQRELHGAVRELHERIVRPRRLDVCRRTVVHPLPVRRHGHDLPDVVLDRQQLRHHRLLQ